ncbi:hypothetical protein [Vibrio fluvialis]|uniref:hypothetical protein n=1 Tax=Vibrio fluvialis TaxID=676 RepID=UPI00111C9832|nr:hypothetical protein [Vibrio fluvialis]TOY95091.1 hypothetical protein DJ016_01970 [Vibrio fluvialis]TRN14660.1 hypothetical protein DM587_01780 [Vibrio fluvialis]
MEKQVKDTPVHSTNLDRIKYVTFVLSFYTYFAGALYFYGMMSSLGFRGASLDSIFSPLVYSQYFVADILSKTFILQDLKVLFLPLQNTLIVTVLIFATALLIHYKVWEKISVKVNRRRKIKEPLVKRNLPLASLLTFPLVYFGQLLTLVALLVLLSLIAIPLFTPYSMGEIAGRKILEHNNGEVCKNFDWNSKEYEAKNIVLSCDRIRVTKSGKSVIGSVIHTDQKFVYAVTNDLLIRVKDDQVVSCAAKQFKQEKQTLKQQNREVISMSCEELYLPNSEGTR